MQIICMPRGPRKELREREGYYKYLTEIREDGGVKFALANGLLNPHTLCPHCLSSDRVSMQRSAESPDGWAFECGACSKQFSIRANTFFSENDLSIPEIVAIMCMFVMGICCYKALCLIGITPRATIVWYSVCCEVCTYAVEMDNIVIGGPGMKVEIVETLMFKRKNVSQQHWLFVGYCVQQRRGFLFPVENRDRGTLHPLIQKHIAPGSVITSDELGAYKDLTSFGWIHRTVDNSQTFVDPKSGAHSQGVKSY